MTECIPCGFIIFIMHYILLIYEPSAAANESNGMGIKYVPRTRLMGIMMETAITPQKRTNGSGSKQLHNMHCTTEIYMRAPEIDDDFRQSIFFFLSLSVQSFMSLSKPVETIADVCML